ncbi:hypothetical protein WICMUC_002940 [Wickerhamomyces mucosus]|uniref:CCHC-type domain-containing protein n=1 Tax=Wickerhamomyces mucosus TaxID=1378264 RepID=A0A9P8PP62_9ASCO|nr:hypothetical protein WICMUC_002940 [Wickerhamomyces mucosus]
MQFLLTEIMYKIPGFPKQLSVPSFLISLQKNGASDSDINAIISAYHQENGPGLEYYTFETINKISNNLFYNGIQSVSNTSAALAVSENRFKSVKCHNCGKLGHIARFCSMPKTPAYKKYLENVRAKPKDGDRLPNYSTINCTILPDYNPAPLQQHKKYILNKVAILL